MKKINKLIALFAALCMLVTLFSGMTAFADGEAAVGTPTPEIITPLWDADSDFISLTFDSEMPLDSLKNIITLKKNGVAVPVTVALNRHASTDAANKTLTKKLSTKYTYTVTPQEGMVLDTVYTLSVVGKILSDDGTKMYTFDFEKYFKVEKLDSGMQYASKTNNAWNYHSGNEANIDTLTYDSESDSLAVKFKASTAWQNAMYYRHYPEYSSFDTTLKDYTVKLTFTPGAGASATQYRFYAVGHDNANNNIGFALTTNSNGTHAVRIQNTGGYYAGSGTAFASDLYSDIVLGQPVELKLSTKGGVMNAYVNGTKVADYAIGADAYGKAAFNIDVNCEGDAVPTATLSNYVMTKAVEVNLTPEVITPLWDADSDFISLTFDKEMPIDALRGIVTLKKNGAVIPATIALNRHASTDAANKTLTKKLSTKYTYTVTPQEGMKIGDIYTLSLDGKFPGENGTKMYTFDFVKSFKVEKLDSGMQYATKTNNAWDYAGGNKTNIDTVTYDSESDSLVIAFEPATAWQTGMYYRHYPEYSAFDESLKDYTVKLTITPGENASATQYRFYAVGHIDANNNIGFALTTNSSGTHAVRIQSALAYYAGSGSTFASDLYSDIVLGQPVELKLSTKDGVMNAYVNGTKVADYAMGTEAYGKAAFSIDVDCEGDAVPTATLSNYVMTKAVEITDLAVGNISVTKADGSAIGDIISGNVNVYVPVCNGSNAEKDVYVVLAFYNGTKMTDCVVADTKKVSAGDDPVTIPFEDIDPKDGTKLKVFVWDNTTNLIPYIDNIEFPAAS